MTKISASTVALLFRAVETLRTGRSVLIVARPLEYANELERLLIYVAKRNGAPCNGPDQPHTYVRCYEDRAGWIENVEVFVDASARGERAMIVPKRVRRVEA